MGKGSVAQALLSGQVSVDRYNTTRMCAVCGVLGDGVLVSHTATEALDHCFALCQPCAERVALGIIAVFTGSAWGVPLSIEGRALMDTQSRMANAAHELHGVLDDSDSIASMRLLVREYLTKPLASWKAASHAFLATCSAQQSQKRSGVERRVAGEPYPREYNERRSGSDRRST